MSEEEEEYKAEWKCELCDKVVPWAEICWSYYNFGEGGFCKACYLGKYLEDQIKLKTGEICKVINMDHLSFMIECLKILLENKNLTVIQNIQLTNLVSCFNKNDYWI